MAAQKTKYDAIVDRNRGEIPRSLVLGLIKSESNFQANHVNPDPDAPGGGPKHGLMQPPRSALAAIPHLQNVQPNVLKDPEENIRIGCMILLEYLKKLRRDFAGAFDRPLEQDANAAAVLVHAYTLGYDSLVKLMKDGKTTSYRVLAAANPSDRGFQRRWADRVLEAARKYGYAAILPAGGALVPSGGGGAPSITPIPGGGANPWVPGPTPKPPGGGSGTPWLLLLGIAAGSGALYFLSQKPKKRRHA